MRTLTSAATIASAILPLCLLCACGGSGQQATQESDMAALCQRFSANAPNDRIETVDRIVANLQAAIRDNQSTNLTTQRIRSLLGRPDKEVETIQTDGSVLVWRYQLEAKSGGGQYQKIDALVLRFKSDVLESVAKQKGWVPKGG